MKSDMFDSRYIVKATGSFFELKYSCNEHVLKILSFNLNHSSKLRCIKKKIITDDFGEAVSW